MHEKAGHGAFNHTLHGGAAPARMQWLFRESSRLPVAVQHWELPPGGSEGMHIHPDAAPLEEIYVLIAGRAEMTVDGTTHRLSPGDAVLAPVGSPHDVRTIGDEPARLLVVWGAPGTPVDWSGYGSGRAAARAAAEALDTDPARDGQSAAM